MPFTNRLSQNTMDAFLSCDSRVSTPCKSRPTVCCTSSTLTKVVPLAASTAGSVRFAESITAVENQHAIHFEDFRDLWYGPEELHRIRHQIRASIHANRTDPQIYRLPRGMELFASEERVHHRRMTRRYIQSASRNGMDQDTIAGMSRHCTARSAEIAVVQAKHDFASVYPVRSDGVRQALPSMTLNRMPPIPIVSRKRNRSSDGRPFSTTRG